jgi:hypothetical protein
LPLFRRTSTKMCPIIIIPPPGVCRCLPGAAARQRPPYTDQEDVSLPQLRHPVRCSAAANAAGTTQELFKASTCVFL